MLFKILILIIVYSISSQLILIQLFQNEFLHKLVYYFIQTTQFVQI